MLQIVWCVNLLLFAYIQGTNGFPKSPVVNFSDNKIEELFIMCHNFDLYNFLKYLKKIKLKLNCEFYNKCITLAPHERNVFRTVIRCS